MTTLFFDYKTIQTWITELFLPNKGPITGLSWADFVAGVSPGYAPFRQAPHWANTHLNPTLVRTLSRRVPPRLFTSIVYSFGLYLHLIRRIFPGHEHTAQHFLYLEWILHAEPDNPKYRDHLHHQLAVTAIGTKIIDLLSPISFSLNEKPTTHSAPHQAEYWDRLLPGPSESKWLEIYKLAWGLAGLFHDFGYMFGFYLATETRMEQTFNRLGLSQDFLARHFRKVVANSLLAAYIDDEWDHELGFNHGALTKLLAESHGAAGAIFLLLAFEQATQYRSYPPYYKQAVDIAALAIFRHDVGQRSIKIFSGKPILWTREPISALLYLVDQLHEFGRMRLEPEVIWPDAVQYRTPSFENYEPIKLEIHGNELKIFARERDFVRQLNDNLNEIGSSLLTVEFEEFPQSRPLHGARSESAL